MAKIPASGSSDFPRWPEKEWVPAIILGKPKVEDRDVPEQFRKDRTKPETKLQAQVVFCATDESLRGARAWKWYTVSLHEKASLRELAVAVLPRDPKNNDELVKVFDDTDKLDAKQLYIMVEYKDGSDYPTVKDYKRLPKAKWVEFFEGDKPAAAAPDEDSEPAEDEEDDDSPMEF